MLIKIVQKGHKALHTKSELVPIGDIKSTKIKKTILQMKQALLSQDDGVGLAAPQIGIPLSIFIVSGRIFDDEFKRGEKNKKESKENNDLVFINPTITKFSKKTSWLSEGCLSVRPVYGEVKRSVNVTIQAYDENGNLFTRGAGGLLAHIFQHEVDHLNGILFVEKARNIREEKINE